MDRLIRRKDAVFKKFIRLSELIKNQDSSKTSDGTLKDQIKYISEYEIEYKQFIDHMLDNEKCTDNIIEQCDNESTKFEVIVQNVREILHIEMDKRAIKQTSGRIKLPELQLPEFDGDFNKWRSFRDTFIAAVHENNQVSDIAKFSYLLGKLKGEAKSLVAQIPISATGYENAWKILLGRYNNERAIVENHLDAILNIPKVSNNNLAELRKILDISNANIDSLQTWEYKLDKLSEALIVRIILGRLDLNSRKEFENEVGLVEFPTWIKLQAFLQKKIRVLESVGLFKKIEVIDINRKPKPTLVVASQFSTEKHFINCPSCKSDHPLNLCPDFIKLSQLDRFQKVKQLKLCINCLKPNHIVSQCNRSTCRRCFQKHHTLLHRYQTEPLKESSISEQTRLQPLNSENSSSQSSHNKSNSDNRVTQHSNNVSNCQVLLSTAIILIQNSDGNFVSCRALLDSASQSNFIAKDLFEKLKYDSQTSSLVISGLNNQKTNIASKFSTLIRSQCSDYKSQLEFAIVPTITTTLPQFELNISKWSLPKNIILADPQFHIPNKIDLLLGAEIFFDVFLKDKIQINPNAPSLIKSKLGWIVGGKFVVEPVNLHLKIDSDVDLNKKLEQLFQNEACETSLVESIEQKECEKIFKSTTYRTDDGRFVVSLPLKLDSSCLGSSYLISKKRFSYLEKRLNRDTELKVDYVNFMDEYVKLGHMKLSTTNSNQGYILPHHPILKPSSSTTKLRVVFDASAKTDNNISLNDILMTGPTVQSELFEIILRFRRHKYVFSADIEKMYRQILINPKQTHLQKVFWYNSTQSNIETYELQTVTYGTTSAPYLATRVLQEISIMHSNKYPVESKILKNDFYVDDCLTGCDNLHELIVIRDKLITMLKEAGMHLRKWSSNSNTFLDSVPLSDQEQSNNKSIKTLGIAWNPILDSLQIVVPKLSENKDISKRTILADLAQIFDPLGFLSPILIKGKIILQVLWHMNINWDDKIPSYYENEWLNFRNSISLIKNCSLERYLNPFSDSSVQLHGFADASEKAFGACLYVRSMNLEGGYTVKLVVSKSRVAPLKKITLPRLELNAALLLARLTTKVIRSFDFNFRNVYLWSDSTIVLSWIKMNPMRLKTYIANRVSEIQSLTTNFIWQHVSSQNNIADLISRGTTVENLVESQTWWNGPLFLQQHEDNWLKEVPKDESPEVTAEVKAENITLSLSINLEITNLIEKYSSLCKLIRLICYLFRFINNINKRKQKISGYFTTDEIKNSLKYLIREVQNQHFGADIHTIKTRKTLSHSSKLKDLNPFIDETSMLRVGGRIEKAMYMSYDSRHPIILPYDSHLTTLIFREEHIKNLHCGPQQLLSIIRQRYWPLRGKLLAKKITRFCIKCFKSKPNTFNQLMGNLPESRLTPTRPFTVTGIDFCGPFFTKNKNQRGGSSHKVYVCIFICFATKGVHLEIVSDMTTESFIASLKRFIFRRGTPSIIWSDNGTNFVGANRELKQLYQLFSKHDHANEIINFCNFKEIQWKFIPPRAPNFGGLWESSIKILKTHIKRVSSNSVMTYEELNTLIVQIEGVMNSRPLTMLSTDPNDPMPLTPAHFLIGGYMQNVPEEDITEIPSNRLTRLQNINKMFQLFWKRFSVEYLHTLQQRRKWKDQKENFKENDLVLIIDENLPTIQWLMGRIVEVFSGSDGINRVFNIKTKNGVIKRSISKICKLPIE